MNKKENITEEVMTAANETESTTVDTEIADSEENLPFVDGTPSETPVVQEAKEDEKKIRTKAFSERLKDEKKKLEKELEDKHQQQLNSIALGRGFNNWKELEEYDRKEKLENMGIKDADGFSQYINDLVSKNPIVLEAEKVIKTQKEREEQEILKDSIKQIHEIDPDISTLDDLISLENYDELYSRVEKGYSLVEAYKIVAFDKLKTNEASKLANTVVNNIENKGHLKTTKGSAINEIIVPRDVYDMYKKNIPNLSDSDIRKKYAEYLKGN